MPAIPRTLHLDGPGASQTLELPVLKYLQQFSLQLYRLWIFLLGVSQGVNIGGMPKYFGFDM